jgi:hypothetical protein
MIVKAKEDQKGDRRGEIDDHHRLRALALLPSASSEARRRLRRRTIAVWGCALFTRKPKIGKDSRAKRPDGELGAPMATFIGLAG